MSIVREFEVSEIFELPYDKSTQWVETDRCDASFFTGNKAQYRDAVGCYVFCMRAGRGCTPYYVGKTDKSFVQEAFNDRNLLNYFKTALKGKGTPCICFVKCDDKQGPVPSRVIQKVETYLIEKAHAKNKNLLNYRKLPDMNWRIKGVVRSGKGQPTKEAIDFKKLMGLATKRRKEGTM